MIYRMTAFHIKLLCLSAPLPEGFLPYSEGFNGNGPRKQNRGITFWDGITHQSDEEPYLVVSGVSGNNG